jgi:hypothetical protein
MSIGEGILILLLLLFWLKVFGFFDPVNDDVDPERGGHPGL